MLLNFEPPGKPKSWTIKKAEPWRIDGFELWCWRKLLRVPWTARRSNQSILKEISPGCTLEGLMLKPKCQYFGHLIQRADSLEKNSDSGKDWRQEEKRTAENEMVGWHHRLNGHEFEQTLGVDDGQGSLMCCSPWGCKESDTTERLNWTELMDLMFLFSQNLYVESLIPYVKIFRSRAFGSNLVIRVKLSRMRSVLINNKICDRGDLSKEVTSLLALGGPSSTH